MTRPASLSALPSSYDEFLYAPIGENPDGAMLTVLSVLARQNLDPWEQAADMSRMPHDTAARRLSSMITASYGQSTAADQAATADRLIALLPSRTASADSKREPDAASQGQLVVHRSATNNLMVIAIYICVMVLSQWMAASLFQKAPTEAVAAPAAASTLGEKIPSGPGDGPTSPSPQ
jgi:hypothetical protein